MQWHCARPLLVSLDDVLAVVREFLNPNASRSGLDRCVRRHGVGSLRDLQAKQARPKHNAFKAYEPGYIHIDVKYLPQMADETRRRYLFVAIDRAMPEGKKELVGFRVGVRESARRWHELLVEIKARGLAVPPEIAVGDWAMGFWKALDEVFPNPINGVGSIGSPTP